jgi:hypothetical protein
MPTVIAVILTTLWTGVGNVVTAKMDQWKRCSSTDCSIFVFCTADLVQIIGRGKDLPTRFQAGTQGEQMCNSTHF